MKNLLAIVGGVTVAVLYAKLAYGFGYSEGLESGRREVLDMIDDAIEEEIKRREDRWAK